MINLITKPNHLSKCSQNIDLIIIITIIDQEGLKMAQVDIEK